MSNTPSSPEEGFSDSIRAEGNLYVHGRADFGGGEVCIVSADLDEAKATPCTKPAWGTRNYIKAGIGGLESIPIEAAPLKVGQWRIRAENRGTLTSISPVFTIHPCKGTQEACFGRLSISQAEMQKYKDAAKGPMDQYGKLCDATKFYSLIKSFYKTAGKGGGVKSYINDVLSWAEGLLAKDVPSVARRKLKIGDDWKPKVDKFSIKDHVKANLDEESKMALFAGWGAIIDIGVWIIKGLSCQASAHYRDIYNDPPDKNYQTVDAPVFEDSQYFDGSEIDTAAMHSLNDEAAYARAGLTAYERFQGAEIDGNIPAQIKQLRAGAEYINKQADAVEDRVKKTTALIAELEKVPAHDTLPSGETAVVTETVVGAIQSAADWTIDDENRAGFKQYYDFTDEHVDILQRELGTLGTYQAPTVSLTQAVRDTTATSTSDVVGLRAGAAEMARYADILERLQGAFTDTGGSTPGGGTDPGTGGGTDPGTGGGTEPKDTVVTPVAPTITPAKGCALGNIKTAQTEGVEYTVENATPGFGEYVVSAKPLKGYVFEANAQSQWAGNLGEKKDCTVNVWGYSPQDNQKILTNKVLTDVQVSLQANPVNEVVKIDAIIGAKTVELKHVSGHTYRAQVEGLPQGTHDVQFNIEKVDGQTLRKEHKFTIEANPVTVSGQALKRDLMPEENVVYTLSVTNNYEEARQVKQLSMVMPEGFTFQKVGSGQEVPDVRGNTLVWEQLSLAPNSTSSFGVTLKASKQDTNRQYVTPEVSLIPVSNGTKVTKGSFGSMRVLKLVTPVGPLVVPISECGKFGAVDDPGAEGLNYSFTPVWPRSGEYTAVAKAQDGYAIAPGAVAEFKGDLGAFRYCKPTVAISTPKDNPELDPGDVPVEGLLNLSSTGDKINIVILVDKSTSMYAGTGDCNGDGVNDNRYVCQDEAVRSLDKYLQTIPGAKDKIKMALTSLDGGWYAFPMSTGSDGWTYPGEAGSDPAKYSSMLYEASVKTGGSSSHPEGAVAWGIEKLKGMEGQNLVFILTDGGSSHPQLSSLKKIAASNVQVRAFSITVESSCAPGAPLWSYADAANDRCIVIHDPTKISAALMGEASGMVKSVSVLHEGAQHAAELDSVGYFRSVVPGVQRAGAHTATVRVLMNDGSSFDTPAPFRIKGAVPVVPTGPGSGGSGGYGSGSYGGTGGSGYITVVPAPSASPAPAPSATPPVAGVVVAAPNVPGPGASAAQQPAELVYGTTVPGRKPLVAGAKNAKDLAQSGSQAAWLVVIAAGLLLAGGLFASLRGRKEDREG
ncbi:MAG: hypothetical protein Q4G30_08255 [Actinomycetaceae bacterium]|nr:hypothetical protein [Actinomycetaceae bacterium]